MRLTRIRLRDWMPFPDVDLDLSEMNSVVVVGENGTGKSALLDAITWAIYDRTRQPGGGEGSSPDKLIHVGADSTLVDIEWQAGDHAVRVTRERFLGREGKLRLSVDGIEESHHTMAATRSAIVRWAGLPFAPMIAGPIMVQAQLYPTTVADSLLRAGPSARKDILLEVFGSTDWAPLYDQAKVRRDAAVATAAAIERQIDDLAGQLGDEQQLRTQLEVAHAAVAEADARLAAIDEQIAAARERAAAMAERAERLHDLRETVNRALASIKGDQQAIERHERSKVEMHRAIDAPEPSLNVEDPAPYGDRIREAEAGVAESNDARVKLAEARAHADAARTRIAAFQQAQTTYEGIVATVPCGAQGKFASCRFLTERPDRQAIAGIEAELPEYETAIEHLYPLGGQLAERQTALAELRTELRRVETQDERAAAAHREWKRARETATDSIATADREIGRLKARIDDETRVATDASAHRDQLEAEAGEIESVGHLQAQLMAQRSTALGAKQEAERPLRQLEAQLIVVERARTQLEAARTSLSTAQQDASTYADLAAAFHRDGIPTMLIEDAVPLIEQHANDVLAHMPGDLRVALVSGRTTAAGTVSDRLDIMVSDEGYEREHTMLSIGQRFRVDLALRVALGRVLSHRVGRSVRTLWLDEPLAALDTRARQAVVETLNAVQSEFGLIVVVSHADDINDAFANRILVARDGSNSTAVLA